MGKIVYLTGSAENSLYDLLLLSHQTGKDQQNELFRKASSILYDSAALLKDALVRGAGIPELADTISRMHLLEGDSRELLKGLSFHPDIVLLDPMFPGRQKSGLVKKKAQLLQKLEKPCEDEEGLLQAAVSAGPRKIVIKRPLKGPFLAGRKPDYSITGKTIRYDCLLVTTA